MCSSDLLPPADWPTNHDGLGTLPHDDPSWQAFHRNDPGMAG